MYFGFRPRIRHPFFPGLALTPAGEAKTVSNALYGTFEELLRAAEGGARAKRAVFLTIREGEPALSEDDRDALWARFQVPVFLLLLDGKDRVLAYECEAQTGLHVSPKHPMARAVSAVCECGRPGDKLAL